MVITPYKLKDDLSIVEGVYSLWKVVSKFHGNANFGNAKEGKDEHIASWVTNFQLH